MTVHDQLLIAGPPADRAADADTSAEVEEAERLLSDLAALLDAGLIEMHKPVFGPVRYGVT